MTEDQALAPLQDILARPEYQVDQAGQAWWDQLLRPIWDVVNYLLALLLQSFSDATSGRQGWYGIGVLAVCVLAGIGVAVYLVRAVRLSVTREGLARRASLAERRERSERLWQTAHQLAELGKWSEAVRVVYLSALYALDERALLHVESTLTNREHLRQLTRTHPDVSQTFAAVVDRYDGVRYGQQPVTPATFAELSDLVSRARSMSVPRAA